MPQATAGPEQGELTRIEESNFLQMDQRFTICRPTFLIVPVFWVALEKVGIPLNLVVIVRPYRSYEYCAFPKPPDLDCFIKAVRCWPRFIRQSLLGWPVEVALLTMWHIFWLSKG